MRQRAKTTSAALLAAAVLGGAGVAVALVISGEAAAVDDKTIFCSEYAPNAQAESSHQKWLNQNPGEKTRWEGFRDAICASGNPTPPTMLTARGRGLVAAGKMALPEAPPPPTTTTTTTPTTTTTTTTTEPPPPAGTIQPGQSWQAAYDAAAAGSTLGVAAGSHGAPSLTGTKSVTFLGATGAVVSKMPSNASNVTFQNIDIDTGSAHGQYSASEPRGVNITWRSVDVRGNWASVHTWGTATGFRWLGGSLIAPGQRNCSSSDGQPLWLNANNAIIDGVSFGVFDSGDCSPYGAFHMEAIRVQGADDISVLNSTFSQGSDTGSGHIFITTTSPSSSQPQRFRVENTIFPPLVGYYAIQIHTNVGSYDSYVYKRNRFDQAILDPAPYVNLVTCGNTGQVPASWKVAC